MTRWLSPKIVLNASALAVVAAAGIVSRPSFAQVPPPRQAATSASAATIVVPGNIEWIERAAVATKRPGVIEFIELTLGTDTKKGDEIAFLDAGMAKMERAIKEVPATDRSPIEIAEAKRELAAANMARAERLKNSGGNGVISPEEYQTKQAELKLADATLRNEIQKMEIAKKELDASDLAVAEHVIRAPFDGEILDVLKQPGEAVQAMEPVVQMARTDMVRFFGYVPLEVAAQLQKGMIVDVTPVVDGTEAAIEKKRFRGKLVFVGPEISASRTRAEVQIKADLMNNQAKDLRVGHKAEMTIYLDKTQVPAAPDDMLPEKVKEGRPQLGLNRSVVPPPAAPVQARAN